VRWLRSGSRKTRRFGGSAVILELAPAETDLDRLRELGCEVFTAADAPRRPRPPPERPEPPEPGSKGSRGSGDKAPSEPRAAAGGGQDAGAPGLLGAGRADLTRYEQPDQPDNQRLDREIGNLRQDARQELFHMPQPPKFACFVGI
jgi:hypothetical protein